MLSKMAMDTAFSHKIEEKETTPSLTQNESSLQHFFLTSIISQKDMTEKRKGNDT